ncbi:hypothetical protein [Blastomonas sp.]|uniref:hypothetical protein n=1 Tax=Blastomonas sp. TaxID=1909299 RepID=UPI0035936F25
MSALACTKGFAMTTNDNESALGQTTSQSSDAHGQAALLLIESLIHGLCENATLLTAEAIDIADRAASVQRDQAAATNDARASMWRSHALLMAISASLRTDDEGDPSSLTLLP